MTRKAPSRGIPARARGHWVLIIVLVLALALRLGLAPMRGHIHDIAQFKAWISAGLENPPWRIYSTSTANYPPLGVLPLLVMGALHRWVWPHAGLEASSLTALLKLPAIAADLALAGLIYRWVGRRHSRRTALICAAGYAFNPAVWYVSAWWGQLDSLVALAIALAVQAASQRRDGQAWAWLAAGFLIKPQAAIVAPVILIASWRHGQWRSLGRGALAGGAVLGLVAFPLAWLGQLSVMVSKVRALAGRQLFLTMNAHNLWYLVTGGRGSFAARGGEPLLDTEPLIGPLTGWQIGVIFLASWCLLVSWTLWRASASHYPAPALSFAAAALVAGLYMLAAESHERYLFPALGVLALVLPEERAARWLYGILSATLWLNLLWVDPAVPLPRVAGQLGWGMPVALVNVAALAWVAGLLVSWTRPWRAALKAGPSGP
jgi:dolichyl-phosphate-mannose-protein mannosyltransferase